MPLSDASQPEASRRELVAIDSPAMKFAIAACNELFSGAPVDVEVVNDPEEPDRSWYCLNVMRPGDARDCIERTSRWYDRLDAVHREAVPYLVVSVIPVT
jgi:hypothetical protein